ncbi:hypothetical protein TNCV_4181911 [Trichonephila clavipes]|nr:hypothetical protein TNCV_4181911 [Trichonephila clavipes]
MLVFRKPTTANSVVQLENDTQYERKSNGWRNCAGGTDYCNIIRSSSELLSITSLSPDLRMVINRRANLSLIEPIQYFVLRHHFFSGKNSGGKKADSEMKIYQRNIAVEQKERKTYSESSLHSSLHRFTAKFSCV